MTSKGVLLLILRCEGIESRVLFPDRKTASCLLKVCVPSGISWLSGVTIFSSRASSSMSILLLKAGVSMFRAETEYIQAFQNLALSAFLLKVTLFV